MTFAKCAPVPSRAPVPTSHSGGGGALGRPSTTHAGAVTNATAYGSGESGEDFNPMLYAHPQATPARCSAAADRPESSDSGSVAAAAASAAKPTVRRPILPAGIGLSD